MLIMGIWTLMADCGHIIDKIDNSVSLFVITLSIFYFKFLEKSLRFSTICNYIIRYLENRSQVWIQIYALWTPQAHNLKTSLQSHTWNNHSPKLSAHGIPSRLKRLKNLDNFEFQSFRSEMLHARHLVALPLSQTCSLVCNWHTHLWLNSLFIDTVLLSSQLTPSRTHNRLAPENQLLFPR